MTKRKGWTRLICTAAAVATVCLVFYHLWFVQPIVRRAKAAEEAVRSNAVTREQLEALKTWRPIAEQTLEKLNVGELKAALQLCRSQLQLYKLQHNEQWPPLKGLADTLAGETQIDGRKCGPYLLHVPANPWTGGNTVGGGPVGGADWYYNEKTGEFRANDDLAHADY